MTLTEVIHAIELSAGGQPGVHSIVRNDIFRLNTYPDAKYAVFGWTQGQHTSEIASSLVTFRFTFFYIDRLTHDLSNQVKNFYADYPLQQSIDKCAQFGLIFYLSSEEKKQIEAEKLQNTIEF